MIPRTVRNLWDSVGGATGNWDLVAIDDAWTLGFQRDLVKVFIFGEPTILFRRFYVCQSVRY